VDHGGIAAIRLIRVRCQTIRGLAILLLPSTIWVTDVLPVCGMVHGVIVATLLIKEGFLTVSGKTKPTSFNPFYREQEI
jgi:hypothetical protein